MRSCAGGNFLHGLGEAHAPLGPVARADAGGTFVDAHDGTHHGVEVLVLEGDLLASTEAIAAGARCFGRGRGVRSVSTCDGARLCSSTYLGETPSPLAAVGAALSLQRPAGVAAEARRRNAGPCEPCDLRQLSKAARSHTISDDVTTSCRSSSDHPSANRRSDCGLQVQI